MRKMVNMGIRPTVIGTVTAPMAGLPVAIGAPAAQAATVDTNAWYVMVNRNSGKALDVAGASSADGAAITQWARHDGTNQHFQFVDSGDGSYRLRRGTPASCWTSPAGRRPTTPPSTSGATTVA